MNMDNPEEVIMEEGELSSDSCDDYTPLERPQNYSKVPQPVIEDSESEEQDHSSEDSDDSTSVQRTKCKRPKIKLKPRAANTSNRKKKFDIWTTKVQEDVLSETLNTCDVTQKDRSRDVESYDYTISHRYEVNGSSNKRTREDRSNIHRRLGKRDDHIQVKEKKGASRKILDLDTNNENTDEEIAKDMANKLCELKEDLLVRSLKLIGREKCFEFFKKTQEIEADGGMSVMNFTRRRTPGGVFFYLMKMDDSIEQKLKTEIFIEERRRDSKEKKKKQALKWKQQKDRERAKILPELLSKAQSLIENRHLKEVSEAVFKNPPPTPETDGHENSCDDIESTASAEHSKRDNQTLEERNPPVVYDDDVLDIRGSNMDMF